MPQNTQDKLAKVESENAELQAALQRSLADHQQTSKRWSHHFASFDSTTNLVIGSRMSLAALPLNSASSNLISADSVSTLTTPANYAISPLKSSLTTASTTAGLAGAGDNQNELCTVVTIQRLERELDERAKQLEKVQAEKRSLEQAVVDGKRARETLERQVEAGRQR